MGNDGEFSVSKQHEHWYDDVLLLHMIRANAESIFVFRLSQTFLFAKWIKKLFLSFIHHSSRRDGCSLIVVPLLITLFMKLSDTF